jgi:hypothetical protein
MSIVNVPFSQVSNTPAVTPPEWIFEGQAVFDGDWISLKNNAWANRGGSVLRRNGNSGGNTDTTGGREVERHFSGVEPNAMSSQSNQWTWCIRRCFLDDKTSTWHITDFDLSKQVPVGYNEPFILLDPSENWCLGTDVPIHTGLSNNGDYRVKSVPLEFLTMDKPCGLLSAAFGTTFRGFTSRDCKDWLDMSTRVWYFKPKSSSATSPVTYGSDVQVRNFYTVAKDWWRTNRPLSQAVQGLWNGALVGSIVSLMVNYNGGRNLTQKDGAPEVVKLALTNDDSIDRSNWKVFPWQVNKWQIRRSLNARPLAACRPGQGRHFLTSACTNPPQLTSGYHYGQNGQPVQGACPAGSTRDAIGYCDDPRAAPTTSTGQVNVLYNKTLHDRYLAQLAEEERAREEQSNRDRIAAITCPEGTTKDPNTGECQLGDERGGNGGAALILAPSPNAPDSCGEDYVYDPVRGNCVHKGGVYDPRSWWEKLWYAIFGYNWEDVGQLEKLEIMAAIGVIGTVAAVTTLDNVEKAVINEL